jgi:16S rRNA (cytidine1402-2'-O)-methyltransferase
VTAIPGPSALTTALALSGIPVDGFVYLGFLPRRRKDRLAVLESEVCETRPLLALETPHRLRAALTDMHSALGDRGVVVARELTKLHEEVFRGTVPEALEHFRQPKGEFTLVIEGASEVPSEPGEKAATIDLLSRLRDGGMRARAAVDLVAEQTGLPRREVYRVWVTIVNVGSKEI